MICLRPASIYLSFKKEKERGREAERRQSKFSVMQIGLDLFIN